MKILVAYFSKTDHTRLLAEAIGDEFRRRGHSVVFEEIKRAKDRSWVREILSDISSYPLAFTRVLFSSRQWKLDFFRTYNQVEEDIRPLTIPDASEFDRVCIGGPKWVYISYPVARYIKTIEGLDNKAVGSFCTFCGPPIKSFEIDMIDIPMEIALESRGAKHVASTGLTTAFHEAGLGPIFRLLSLVLFRRPISEFTLGSEHARKEISEFCDKMEK